jgi:2-oxo-3-hexenedioate decarboxylase
LETAQIHELAQKLHQARTKACPVEQLSKDITLTRDDAYSIQEEGIKLREQEGEKIIGLKMGLTSEAKRKQMNLDAPLYGVLTDKMQCFDVYKMQGSIHPKIEPEVVFFFNKELEGNVSREQVLEACESIAACMEILDSRYEQFKYFSMEDVISDNSSSSHYIFGEKVTDFKELDLKNLTMTMKVNGEVAQQGSSVAISGDPVVSVIQQCELLARRGKKIEAGSFVLAGAATPAVSLEPGMLVELEVQGLKPVKIDIV